MLSIMPGSVSDSGKSWRYSSFEFSDTTRCQMVETFGGLGGYFKAEIDQRKEKDKGGDDG